MEIPAEVYDLIIEHLGGMRFRPWKSGLEYRLTRQDRRNFESLRLVNQMFCSRATRCLFQEICRGHQDFGIESSHFGGFRRLLCLSKTAPALTVQKLDIAIPAYLEGASLQAYVEELSKALPLCLERFSNLRALHISGPKYSLSSHADRIFPDIVRLKLNEGIMNALHYVPIPLLIDLQLKLPCTNDFARLLPPEPHSLNSPAPPNKTLSQLRHLSVKICDNTGPGGHRYFHKAPTETQTRYPNLSSTTAFLAFISAAGDLETLRIASTHLLPLSNLHTSSLKSLTLLELSGLQVDPETLTTLCGQNQQSLQVICLHRLELTAKTWTQAFESLCSLPHLEELFIQALGYACDGQSAQLRPRGLPPISMPQEVETRLLSDLTTLEKLKRKIAAMRVFRRGLHEDKRIRCSKYSASWVDAPLDSWGYLRGKTSR